MQIWIDAIYTIYLSRCLLVVGLTEPVGFGSVSERETWIKVFNAGEVRCYNGSSGLRFQV